MNQLIIHRSLQTVQLVHPAQPATRKHRKSRIERYRFIVNILLYSMVLASCFEFNHREAWNLSYRLMEILGYVLVGMGILGRLWCGMYVFGRKSKKLCKTGPYSVCRNPLYFFSFITGMGVAAQSNSPVVLIAFAAIFWGYYFLVIKSEEKGLAALFGREYEKYLQTVPCIIPRPRRYHSPENMIVSSRAFLPAMAKSIWPVLLVASADLIEMLKGLRG
jgi:protein-S-isoprenylcysteine O-methyltransferase Ste14